MNRSIVLGVGLLMAAAAFCWAQDRAGGTKGPASKASPKVVAVLGRVEPTEVVEIGALVAGTVQAVMADFGQKVKQGEVLARLDSAPYEAAAYRAKATIAKAEAEYELAAVKMAWAKRNLDRVLRQRDAAAVSEVEGAKSELELAEATMRLTRAGLEEQKASLRRVELDLAACTIHAPFDGVVLNRRASMGQIAPAGAGPGLFQIARDLRTLHVLASVAETDIGRIQAGQAARISVEALPDEVFQGKVSQLRLNANTRRGTAVYTVVIAVDNADGKLLPYLTAKVSIAVGDGR